MDRGRESKKLNEQRVFGLALGRAREHGGYSRRVVDRIAGEVVLRDDDESPDIVLRTNRKTKTGVGRLVGVEHFRVDQLLEERKNQKKRNSRATAESFSAVARWGSEMERMQNRYSKGEIDELSPALLDDFGRVVNGIHQAYGNAYLGSFVKAFSDGFDSHLNNVNRYRAHLEGLRYAGDVDPLLVFLVETHCNYSDLTLWEGYKSKGLADGYLPIFTELVRVIERCRGMVDYVLVAMCPVAANDVVDAVLIDCMNPSLSLAKAKVPICEYLGSNHDIPIHKGIVSHMVPRDDGEEITFWPVVDQGEALSPEFVFWQDVSEFWRAIGLRRAGQPFTANHWVQMFLCLVGDYADRDYSDGAEFDRGWLYRWKKEMGEEEWQRRSALYERKADLLCD